MRKEYNGLIDISYPDKPYVIYTITSEDNTDMSIYVGTSSNPILRATKHASCRNRNDYKHKEPYIWMNYVIDIQKKKVIFKIIERDYIELEAFKREIEVVKYYKELGYTVLNNSDGGRGLKGRSPWNKGMKMSPEIIKKYSDGHLGIIGGMKDKNHSEKTKKIISLRNKERAEKGWINPQKKKVYKYDNNYKLVSVFSCLYDAAKDINMSQSIVGEWCRKEKVPRNEFIWSYETINNVI